MLDLVDVTPTGKLVAEIDGEFYLLQERDKGLYWREDAGLWRATKVDIGVFGMWSPCDDDDFLIDRDGKVVARETGWRRERRECGK